MLTVQSDNICASSWMDKVVIVMYTGFNPLVQSTVMRKKKDGTKVTVPCHVAFEAYNKHMGAVDQGDQLRGYYHRRFKSREFYKYIFRFLVEVALTNAFILYRESHPRSKIVMKKFLELLALQLIAVGREQVE